MQQLILVCLPRLGVIQDYMLPMYKQITIQTLHKQGLKQSEISRTIGCHRNTVRNIINSDNPIEKQTRVKSSIFDAYKDTIKQWKDEKVTKFRIHEKLRDEYGVHSSYVNLCIYMNKHLPKPVEAFGVQITEPGEEAEIDFGYLGMLPGLNGKLVRTYGLVIVLAYSRVGYYAICYDQKLKTLIKELKEAFVYFDGVPKKLKVDNMKTAVILNNRYNLLFNKEFLEFANHYQTVIVPCEPYSPEQKGKVESGIKYLQNNFVNGREFTDDLDVKAKLKDWMVHYANQRTHGTTRKVPWTELIETERKALQPLPQEEYSLFERCVRKVGINSHIHFDNNYYSVPCQYVGKEVTVRWNEKVIRIIYQDQQVALHVRCYGKGQYIFVRSHLPEHKVYSETERQAKYEEKMRSIGEISHEFFKELLKNKQKSWTEIARAILGICEEYGKETVELTLKRAIYYETFDVNTIRHIAQQKLYLLPTEPILPKTIEEEPVMARSLAYYAVIYDANSLPAAA